MYKPAVPHLERDILQKMPHCFFFNDNSSEFQFYATNQLCL